VELRAVRRCAGTLFAVDAGGAVHRCWSHARTAPNEHLPKRGQAVRMLMFVVGALGVLVAQAGADEYWITYEANDLPENEGWNRSWGNNEGPFHGDGAYRTVEDGILTMDSLYSQRVYDYAYLRRLGELDSDPGELFVIEWRLKVDEVTSYWGAYDPSVGCGTDGALQLALGFHEDWIESVFEDDVYIPIDPYVFHEYRVLSWDMYDYTLYIDGETAYEGSFWQGAMESYMAWGDDVSGAASLTHWDYLRFGVIPEPGSLTALAILCVCVGYRSAR
jgi:hypothetical protein